jgi:nucleotide-binding universal stress UspA family protein
MDMKVLIPVDGSANANRAIDYVIASVAWLKESPQIYLLNVQWNLASANVKMFIDQDTIKNYYREQGQVALAEARSKLDAGKFAYSYHVSVGSPADAIVLYAQEHQVDQIVMSAQGESTFSQLLLGSVADKVAHLSPIPVVLVK